MKSTIFNIGKMKYISFFILAVFLSLGLSFNAKSQTVYTVTKTTDPDPFRFPYNFVDSLCSPEMLGTLQWAVRKVNDTGGNCRIVFNIPGQGPHTIFLTDYSPTINNSVSIDGTTQSGYTPGNPSIIIDGQDNISTAFYVYNTDNIEITGLRFEGFRSTGIYLSSCDTAVISSNIISFPNANYVLSKIGFARIRIANSSNISVYNNILNTVQDTVPTPGQYNYGIAVLNSSSCKIGDASGLNGNNEIYGCYTGIFLDNSQSIRLSGNIVHDNISGILYQNGSNSNKKSAIIMRYESGVITGIGEAGDIIEVFGCSGADNAEEYLGSVTADEEGNWALSTTTTYSYFTATATDSHDNTSVFSDPVLLYPACDAPSGLSATGGISSSHTLAWDGVAGVTYNVAVGVENLSPLDSNWMVSYSQVTGDSVTVTGLNDSTAYEYYINASCGSGLSHWSGPHAFNPDCSNVHITGTFSVSTTMQVVLSGTGTPATVNPWVSSNPMVATVNNDGIVYGISEGITSITYTDLSGCTAVETVTVKERPLYESNRIYLLVTDSAINLSNYPEVLSEFGIDFYEKPFASLNSDYLKRLYRITFNDSINIDSLNIISGLSELEITENAEKIPIMYLFTDFCTNPNDTYTDMYYLNQINAAEACEFYYPGYENRDPSTVAIVEGPVYIDHSDLIGNSSNNNCDANTLVGGECLSNIPYPVNSHFISHGTEVAGVAGAASNNGMGIYSVGWNNKLMGVNCADSMGNLFSAWDGITWAAEHGAKVINMSWGWIAGAEYTHYQVLKTIKHDYPDVVFVAACGNYANSVPQYPAAYGEGFNEWEEYDPAFVIAVAAIDENNDRYINTSFGSWVDICAYGKDILTTSTETHSVNYIPTVQEYYKSVSGTSFAAPMVAGVVGQMMSYKPEATPSEIYNCLINSARSDIYGPSHQYNLLNTLGSGRLDAAEALKCLGGDCSNGNPVAVISSSKDLLCPDENVTLTANEGIGYLWSTGDTTQNTVVNMSGSYCVTVTFAEGCTASTCYNLTGTSGQAELHIIENSGIASNDGIVCLYNSFTLSASYGLSYQWSDDPLATSQDRLLNSGSSYCVTVNGIDGCPDLNSSACVDVSWIDINSLVDPGNDQAVCMGDEIILSTSTGGFAEYFWEKQGEDTVWMGQSVTISVAALPSDADNYYLMVTDTVSGCSTYAINSEQNRVTISVITDTSELVIEPVADVCTGGQIQLLESNIPGGTWTGNGVEGNYFNPYSAGAGVHNVTYTVGNGNCILSESINITVTSGSEISIDEVPAMCENSSPYIITTDPPYETSDFYNNIYEFSGPGIQIVATNYDPLVLALVFNPATAGPGTHTISVETTEGDCIMYGETEITVLPIPVINAVDNLCVSSSPVILTANPAGGTWSGIGITNPSAGTFDPSVAGAGLHTVTYQYSNSGAACSNEIVIEVLDQVSNIIIDDVSEICGLENPASVALSAVPAGGDWSGTGVVNNTFYPNLAGYGSHVLTYTFAENTSCEISSSITINYFDFNIAINSNQPACEGNNYLTINPGGFSGFVQIFDSESDLIYNHYYSNIQGQVQLPYLETGDYTVNCMVSPDGVETNCNFAMDFTVLPAPVASITGEESVCGLYTFLYAEGGLSYLWNTGSTSDDVLVDESGIYTVTVTDINGCTAQDDFSVELINEVDEITTVFANNDPCSGIFQFIINPGGNTFHAYILNNNSNVYVYSSPDLASQTNTPVPALPIQLLPGNYTLILNSNNSDCVYYHNIDIPASCMDVSANKIKATCYSSFNGKVEVEISGGTPAYTVYLGQGGSIVSPVYTMLEPGVYTIEVNELFNPAEFFKVIVDDNDPYIINHEEILSSQINYAWLAEDIITTGDITAPVVFEDMTICIGDANDQTFNISHDVTFRNCTVYCATNSYSNIDATQWTVQQENILTLDNSTITSGCPDQLWKGIKLWGDLDENSAHPNDPDLEPAQLIMGNNSNIEFAKTGIFGAYNAVVKITDSRFTNCPTGVELVDFIEAAIPHSTLPNLNPRTYIYRTEFITDDNYIEIPVSHVNIYQTDKINLKGNYFTNSATGLSGSNRGMGIHARNAGFSVTENNHITGVPDLPATPADKSRFEGLYYGIYAENYIARTATIRNCDFINYGEMGAYLKSFTAPMITTNTFTRTQSVPLTLNAGLYLKGCNAYQTENNTFNDGTIGMIVNNSSTYSNEVYRNHFISPLNAFQSYYTNSNADGSAGLSIQCNDYHNSNYHNTILSGNVKKQQGYLSGDPFMPSVSAGNQFVDTYLNGVTKNAFKVDDAYEYCFNYKYWYNMPDDVTDISGYTSDNVATGAINTLFDQDSTCPSGLPGLHLVSSEEQISFLIAEAGSMQGSLNNLIDGGNTAVLLQKVQYLTSKNFDKTCSELLEKSPYLSDTVLTSFMRTSVKDFYVSKTNVLLANSPLPANAYAELENMDLPASYKDQIYRYQDGTNPVVLKQEEIQNVVFEKDLLVNGYMRYGLQSDSYTTSKDSLLNFLAADNNYESKCLLIPVLIAEGRYTEAQTQINTLEYLASNESPALYEELGTFAELQEIIMATNTAASADSLPGIVMANISLLEYIAYNSSHRGSSQAQTLLSVAGIDEFEPEMFLPVENRNVRFSIYEEPAHENYDLDDLIEVYPNPASSELWIEYLILKDKPVNRIELFNSEGKLVLSQPVREGFGVEHIDVSQLSEGTYMLKLGEFTKKISVAK